MFDCEATVGGGYRPVSRCVVTAVVFAAQCVFPKDAKWIFSCGSLKPDEDLVEAVGG